MRRYASRVRQAAALRGGFRFADSPPETRMDRVIRRITSASRSPFSCRSRDRLPVSVRLQRIDVHDTLCEATERFIRIAFLVQRLLEQLGLLLESEHGRH